MRTAALNEQNALLNLRIAVIVDEGAGEIQGGAADYTNRHDAAVLALSAADARLTEFQQAGQTLPPMGEVDYARDLGRLIDHEVRYVNDGVTRSAAYDKDNDYSAWVALKVYADNAHEVGAMQCG